MYIRLPEFYHFLLYLCSVSKDLYRKFGHCLINKQWRLLGKQKIIDFQKFFEKNQRPYKPKQKIQPVKNVNCENELNSCKSFAV